LVGIRGHDDWTKGSAVRRKQLCIVGALQHVESYAEQYCVQLTHGRERALPFRK
jgi:hypothetical protein